MQLPNEPFESCNAGLGSLDMCKAVVLYSWLVCHWCLLLNCTYNSNKTLIWCALSCSSSLIKTIVYMCPPLENLCCRQVHYQHYSSPAMVCSAKASSFKTNLVTRLCRSWQCQICMAFGHVLLQQPLRSLGLQLSGSSPLPPTPAQRCR
jgi:hypothetical protein